jgi:ribonucleoside-triphosphate reductase
MKHITIVKRDGRAVPYEENKIIQAIRKAWEATYISEINDKDTEHIRAIAKSVRGVIIGTSKGDKELTVEFVQMTVENQLMAEELYDVARSYIIYRDARNKARKERISDTGKAMQDIVFADKYSRFDSVKKRRETFNEAAERVLSMHLEQYADKKSVELNGLMMWAFDMVKEKRVLPAMRSLQFGGKAVVAHNLRLYNCSATFVDRPRVFQEILYALLCGCGVGYSVEFEHVERLPKLADTIDEKKCRRLGRCSWRTY